MSTCLVQRLAPDTQPCVLLSIVKRVGVEWVGVGSGMQRPVQRIAGKAATGPEQDLPFVLDDDAVAPAFDERVQEQQAAYPHDDDEDAAQLRALRPRYGHRSPASALAGGAATCAVPQAVHALPRFANAVLLWV